MKKGDFLIEYGALILNSLLLLLLYNWVMTEEKINRFLFVIDSVD